MGERFVSKVPYRPLSPHLQIYKLQMTSFLSLSNRASELFLLFVSFLWAGLILSDFVWLSTLSVNIKLLGLWVIGVGVLYHLLSVIRHLWMSVGFGFHLSTVYAAGWTLLCMWGAGSLLLLWYLIQVMI